MTQDTPQGVAQRVMEQAQERVERVPFGHRAELTACSAEFIGMRRLHIELSAEAQRVWEEQDYTEGEFSGMSYLCAKLGLHIDRTKNRPHRDESEDSDE